jgi:hypothetical protein
MEELAVLRVAVSQYKTIGYGFARSKTAKCLRIENGFLSLLTLQMEKTRTKWIHIRVYILTSNSFA